MILAFLTVLVVAAGCTAGPVSPPSTASPSTGTSTSGPSHSPSASSPGSTSPAPPGSGAAKTGLTNHSIESAGRSRQYLLYVPASMPSGPAPLVVMLHGGSGSAAGAARGFGWNAEADQQHFVVAYPNGLDKSWSVGGGCCGPPARDGVDDVAFVNQVVADVESKVTIDSRRIFATGISEGGMLTYRLACNSTVFAAVGPDAATLLGDCPSPAPVSLLDIHGTADPRIRYDGAVGAGVNHIDGPAIPALAEQWRSHDQCAAPVTTQTGSVTTSSASCPDGRTVEYLAIAGGGHDWPSANPDATSTFWQFFAAHPKP